MNPKIKEKAISLERYGINDFAWKKEDAQVFINSIMKDQIGILGGDVYKLTQNQLEPLYDNWSCEILENESQEEYYLRSKTESLTYIENYRHSPDEKIVFSMTFTEGLK